MDLDSLFNRAFDGFGSDPEFGGFPGFPGTEKASGNGQAIANNDISRCSRISRSEKEVLGSDQNSTRKNATDFSGGDRAREDPFKTPGNPGNPGKEAKTLAEPTTSLFPEREKVPGNDRENHPLCEQNLVNSNHLAISPGDPLPISPADIRAGVARELRALAEDGREGSAALRDAVAITAAKIRNSEALAERQAHGGRCHVCDGPLDDSSSVVAVMTGKRGAHLHLHAGCCAAHSSRMAALVDRIMVAAGYGADERMGEAT